MARSSGTFKKGHKHSNEVKRKISESRKKPENRLSSIENLKKTNNWGRIPWNKGGKWPEDHKRKISEKLRGEKSSNWRGGISRGFIIKNSPRPKPEQCEVCGAFAGTGKAGIHYDHDHTTGKFRGWICMRCNIALGMVKDNAETLIALAEYLKKSRLNI